VSSPIFISYASVDQDVAETVCNALQARGHSCWIACRNIGPGENFQESIVQAIRSARVMLLIFTGNANNSEEIKKELVLAGRHRVTVLPVRVEDVAPNDAIAYEFATRQWIDLFKDWEREIDRLGAQIDAIVAAPKPGESESVAAKPAPRSKSASLPVAQKPSYGALIAAAVVIVAALGAGGVYLYMRTAPQTAAAPANVSAAATAPAAAPAPVVSPPPAAQAPVPPPAAVATPPAPQPIPAPQPATSAQTRGFDGAWSITFSCPAVGSALGYSYRFAAQISDGMLHGEKGEKGKPGWLTIDGKIGGDGSLDNLYVDSLVGASQVAVGNVPREPSSAITSQGN
jgi:hypothetical protein